MIKKMITFEDFDGNTVTEAHYFHLSKSELIDMELATDGGMSKKLFDIGKSDNGAEIIKMFREIIGAAYGQRVDGSSSQFFKSQKITDEFLGSLAFDALLTELVTDANASVQFVNGLMPKDLDQLAAQAQMQQTLAGRNVETVKLALVGPNGEPDVRDTGLMYPLDATNRALAWAFREPTQAELGTMHKEQLQDVFRRKSSDWTPPV